MTRPWLRRAVSALSNTHTANVSNPPSHSVATITLRRSTGPPSGNSPSFPAPTAVVLADDRITLGVDAARAVVVVAAVFARRVALAAIGERVAALSSHDGLHRLRSVRRGCGGGGRRVDLSGDDVSRPNGNGRRRGNARRIGCLQLSCRRGGGGGDVRADTRLAARGAQGAARSSTARCQDEDGHENAEVPTEAASATSFPFSGRFTWAGAGVRSIGYNHDRSQYRDLGHSHGQSAELTR